MKKIISFILISSILMLNTAFANINATGSDLDFSKVNKKVLKYVMKAQNEEDFELRKENFLKASKYIKNKKQDDVLLKAGLYYLIASDASSFKDYENAKIWYQNTCDFLEKNNKIQDNYLAFACLMNILSISKKTKDDNLYKETLIKIENTQQGLYTNKTEEMRVICGKLFEYYNNIGDVEKSEKYEKLIKSY